LRISDKDSAGIWLFPPWTSKIYSGSQPDRRTAPCVFPYRSLRRRTVATNRLPAFDLAQTLFCLFSRPAA